MCAILNRQSWSKQTSIEIIDSHSTSVPHNGAKAGAARQQCVVAGCICARASRGGSLTAGGGCLRDGSRLELWPKPVMDSLAVIISVGLDHDMIYIEKATERPSIISPKKKTEPATVY